MSLLQNFPHKCTIRRRIRTQGDFGGSVDSFLNEQTNVVCWEQPLTQKESKEFGKQGMDLFSKIYFTTNPNVGEQHQIIITKRNGVAVTAANQIPLDVVIRAMPDATAGLAIMYKIFCTQITGRND